MTIHTPITIRTAPETCIARTQRPSAERLLAGIFYIDVALDVGPTSSVLAHAAPSQSDRRCHRQRSLTPTVSRPHSRRMSRVRVPSLPTFEDHRKTNRLRQYERHPALAFLSGASPVQRSAGTPDRCRSTSALGSRSRHIPAEKGSNRINPKHAPGTARAHTRCMPGTERRPLGRALSVECPSFSLFPNAAADPRCQAAGLAVTPIAPQGKALCGTWHLAFDIRPTGTNVSPVSRVEAGGFDCLPSRHQHARNTNTVGIDREPPDRPP